MKRLLTLLCTVMILLAGGGMSTMKVRAQSYGSSWQDWSMNSSDYYAMRTSGCRVMAYAKMLSETGWNYFGNPDDLYMWGKQHNNFSGDISEKGRFGTLLMDYVESCGGAISKSNYKITKDRNADCRKIMELIRQGYSCFLVCGGHTVYIGAQASLAYDTPVILDSDGVQRLYSNYRNYSFTDLNYFMVSGGGVDTSNDSEGMSASDIFSNIYASSITQTGAYVKTDVSVDCRQLSAAGMEWGYISNGREIPQTEFCWKTGNILNRVSVDFGKEADRNGNTPVLSPGSTVYYRFFVVKKDGSREYAPKLQFTTLKAGTSGANAISFDSISVTDGTTTRAFVKTNVTANCSNLTATGVEWGYLSGGREVPQTEFYWRTGQRLNYVSIAFGQEQDRNGNIPSLRSGSTVYYRFFAVKKDGTRTYSETGFLVIS